MNSVQHKIETTLIGELTNQKTNSKIIHELHASPDVKNPQLI